MTVSGNQRLTLLATGMLLSVSFPAPEGETIPWAKLYSHAFQGPGGWYIENSLTTLNEKDPVGEVNRRLWNSGSDEDKETARKQKRKKLSITATSMS